MAGKAAALLHAMAIVAAVAATSFCDRDGAWEPTWVENFDGDSLNPDDWNVQVGDDGRNIGSCREAWCSADNVEVGNGVLTITSKREESHGMNYTTGGVTTQGKQHWAFEPAFRLCVSAILPGGGGHGKGQGIWPAIWMMPDDDTCDPDEV